MWMFALASDLYILSRQQQQQPQPSLAMDGSALYSSYTHSPMCITINNIALCPPPSSADCCQTSKVKSNLGLTADSSTNTTNDADAGVFGRGSDGLSGGAIVATWAVLLNANVVVRTYSKA